MLDVQREYNTAAIPFARDMRFLTRWLPRKHTYLETFIIHMTFFNLHFMLTQPLILQGIHDIMSQDTIKVWPLNIKI